jgi:hypothetical protein
MERVHNDSRSDLAFFFETGSCIYCIGVSYERPLRTLYSTLLPCQPIAFCPVMCSCHVARSSHPLPTICSVLPCQLHPKRQDQIPFY